MDIAGMYDTTSVWILANAIRVAGALVVLVVGWVLAGVLSRQVKTLLPRTKRFDSTITPLLEQMVRYGILILTFIIVLGQFGVQTASILAVVGAAGLAIALAMQGTLTNIASGIMLIWLRPFSVGDYIDANGISGTVLEVGLFATQLKSADGVFVFAPNTQIWNSEITNYSHETTRRLDLDIGISYDSDIRKAREILMEMAQDSRVLKEPSEPVVLVTALGDSAVNIRLRMWLTTADFWTVFWEFTEEAKLRFDTAGIEIPFNKVDVNVLHTPELQGIAQA